MASVEVHQQKADLCWELANEFHTEKRDVFLCVNLIIYTLGHLIEAALALQHKHPSAAARGVPHADREAQMRKHLVGKKWIEPEVADRYAELVAMRHTFADDGLQDERFLDSYMETARPLVTRLQAAVREHRVRESEG